MKRCRGAFCDLQKDIRNIQSNSCIIQYLGAYWLFKHGVLACYAQSEKEWIHLWVCRRKPFCWLLLNKMSDGALQKRLSQLREVSSKEKGRQLKTIPTTPGQRTILEKKSCISAISLGKMQTYDHLLASICTILR